MASTDAKTPKSEPPFEIYDSPKAQLPDGTPLKARKVSGRYRTLCMIKGCFKAARSGTAPACSVHTNEAKALWTKMEDAYYLKSGFRNQTEMKQHYAEMEVYNDQVDRENELARQQEEKERKELEAQRVATAAARREEFNRMYAQWLQRFNAATGPWSSFVYKHSRPTSSWSDPHTPTRAELAKQLDTINDRTKRWILSEKRRLEQLLQDAKLFQKQRLYRTCMKTVDTQLDEVDSVTFDVLMGLKPMQMRNPPKSMWDKYLP